MASLEFGGRSAKRGTVSGAGGPPVTRSRRAELRRVRGMSLARRAGAAFASILAGSSRAARRRFDGGSAIARPGHATLRKRSALGGVVLALGGLLSVVPAAAQTENADGSETIWEATMTVGVTSQELSSDSSIDSAGYRNDGSTTYGSLTPLSFSYGGTDYQVIAVQRDTTTIGSDTTEALKFIVTTDTTITETSTFERLSADADRVLALDFNGTPFPLASGTGDNAYGWLNPGFSWMEHQSVPVKLIKVNAPAAPTNLTWTPGDGQVTLNWDIPKDGGSAITKIQYRQKEGSPNNSFGEWIDIPESAETETNATSYAVLGLTNKVAYTFELQAFNNVETSDASDELPTRAGVPPSGTPTVTTTQFWTSNLTVGDLSNAVTEGYSSASGSSGGVLPNESIEYKGNSYEVQQLYLGSDGHFHFLVPSHGPPLRHIASFEFVRCRSDEELDSPRWRPEAGIRERGQFRHNWLHLESDQPRRQLVRRQHLLPRAEHD